MGFSCQFQRKWISRSRFFYTCKKSGLVWMADILVWAEFKKKKKIVTISLFCFTELRDIQRNLTKSKCLKYTWAGFIIIIYNNFEYIENWNHSHIVIISRFIIQRNITFQSFNRTVDRSFISRSLLTRELKRASKEYPVVGERARPYICNYSFCCRKARCRLLPFGATRIIHGSKIPNNSVPSRVHVQ